MRSFLSALQFLTIIPVRFKSLKEDKLRSSMIYFPLIGLLLGAILSAIYLLLKKTGFNEFPANIIVVVALAGLTGGLHLDGLSDTFDSFLSFKDKEEMLKIMRDSHIGVMGVLAIICVMLLKIAFLFSITTGLKSISLVLMCVLGRWSMVFTTVLFPYARKEGKAKVFIEGKNINIFVLALLFSLTCVYFAWKINGVILFAIITAVAYIIAKFIDHKINGITGDTLGAINELTETFTLFSICVIERMGVWII